MLDNIYPEGTVEHLEKVTKLLNDLESVILRLKELGVNVDIKELISKMSDNQN